MQTDWQAEGVPGARDLQGTAVSLQAWRVPADLGNVVQALGLRTFSSKPSGFVSASGYKVVVEIREHRGT